MTKRKTTSEERKTFIKGQRAAEASYKGTGRRLPVDMSFIDRKGNIVHPNKTDYKAAITKRDRYNDKENLSTYNAQYNEASTLNKKYDSLVSRYGKDSKEVYKFEEDKLEMHGKRKPSRLEGMLAIIGLVSGLFFLSNNFTGNVIGSLNQTSSNIIGAALFLVGIVGAFFYFRRR